MKQTKIFLGTLLLAASLFFTGCEKDFDSPPVATLPIGNVITIDSLRNIYTAFDTTITQDLSIYGVVTADEVTGNIYKELYIQDETNAIKLGLLSSSSSDYFIGDKVRVAIKGAIVRRDHNMIVLDSIDHNITIVKQEENKSLTPEIVTITDISSISVFASAYQGKLVQINNVEFLCADVCNTWADAISQSDENRTLIDTLGNSLIVRSSGFSNFAGEQLPFGRGSIVGVVSQYNLTIQLTIRNPNELSMTGVRKSICAACPIFSHTKDFEDQNITSGGWTTQVVTGSFNWTTSNQGAPSYYAKISNFNSGNTPSEAWLISPSFDFSTVSTPTLLFDNAANFSGAQLEVLVSTDYDGYSLPSTASWTPVTATLSGGGFTFVSSGLINLSAFSGTKTFIAFKYTGSNLDGKTWELDNIKIEAL